MKGVRLTCAGFIVETSDGTKLKRNFKDSLQYLYSLVDQRYSMSFEFLWRS